MYHPTPDGSYVYSRSSSQTITYYEEQQQDQTEIKSFDRREWRYTNQGFQKLDCSTLLFMKDAPLSKPNLDGEVECITWYQPQQPTRSRMSSTSSEYIAPHNRYEGYQPRSGIRGNGSFSGSSHSRSTSRQPHSVSQPRARSMSRDVTRQPTRRASGVARERAQPKQSLMPVVNLVGELRRVRRANRAAKAPGSARAAPVQQAPRAVRRKDGTWVKGASALTRRQPPICFEWRDHGSCRFGSRCKFSHHPRPARSTYPRAKPQTSKPVKSNNINSFSALYECGEESW